MYRTRGAPDERFPSAAVALAETTAALARLEASLLFYDHDGRFLRIWLLDARGIADYRAVAASAEQIATAVENIRATVAEPSLVSRGLVRAGADPVKDRLAFEAGRELLVPAALHSALREASTLVIVPALGIGMVPFHALEVQRGRPLIDFATVFVAPSLFEFVHQTTDGARRDLEPFEAPLVVGNPTPAPGFSPLPGAEREAFALAAAFETTALVGAKATKAAVVARLAQADLLYFATHGVADVRDAVERSYLMLVDGVLTAREIQQMRLVARVAVLSACETGVGLAVRAGTIGLARAFQIAGVPNVVMSLWRVDDAATEALMTAFGRELRSHAPAVALRRAAIQLKDRGAPAAHWSAFTVFGSPAAVR